MNLRHLFIVIIILFATQIVSSTTTTVEIVKIQGDVSVRLGMDEKWQKAKSGQVLNEFDTILTGETGEVTLMIKDGSLFVMKNRTILDIADLRTIQENELFLFIMSQKVDDLEPVNKKKIEMGKVSIIHGDDKTKANEKADESIKVDWYQLELKGTRTLYDYGYFANAVVKSYKIMEKYPPDVDCGESGYWLAKSLQSLKYKGQAMDAYQQALDDFKNGSCDISGQPWVNDARSMLNKLKNTN